MSLRETLASVLPDNVDVVRVDREHDMRGLPAVLVAVEIKGDHGQHRANLEAEFARKNGLTDEDIAELVKRKVESWESERTSEWSRYGELV